MPIGPLELGIILLIIVLIFGPKRLPKLGQSLGSGMREFKDSIQAKARRKVDAEDDEDGDEPDALEAPEPAAAQPAEARERVESEAAAQGAGTRDAERDATAG